MFEEHRKTYQEISRANLLIKLIHRYKSSIFREFESIPRTEVDLAEDDIGLVLNEYISIFITSKI